MDTMNKIHNGAKEETCHKERNLKLPSFASFIAEVFSMDNATYSGRFAVCCAPLLINGKLMGCTRDEIFNFE